MDDNTKKSYNQYTLEDFISDPFFAGYVNKSDTEAMAFWPLYIVQHPEQRPLIEEAVIIAKGLQFKKRIIPTDSVETEWNRLSMLIDQSEKKKTVNIPIKNRSIGHRPCFLYCVCTSPGFQKCND